MLDAFYFSKKKKKKKSSASFNLLLDHYCGVIKRLFDPLYLRSL